MPEVNKTPDPVRFDSFELMVETGELRKNGVRLNLSGQPIEVLKLLVATPGKMVTREELQRRLWGKDTFVDFEKGLNAAVSRLREFLCDSATDPKYVETVPGRGYRFIGKVLGSYDGAGPGKIVTHYRIVEIVGRGGMGIVYKALDLKLGRHVALKFLPEQSATNHDALERFRREAITASSLNHPNICTIYEVEEHEGQPFIVMELLQGQTLRECLISSALRRSHFEPMLDIDQLLDIALQILDGLQAAHEKGIIHRDIKPANIFVTNGRLVKILDFGLAKLVGTVSKGELDTLSALATPNSSDPPEHLSEAGAAIGTFGYMAPEQARGEDLDARADLFSFGLVVYEMATGRPAFDGTTADELCRAILSKTPTPVRELNPSIPPALEQLINKALEKNRDLRYQSATELRADLIRVKQAVEPPKVSGPEWPITQQETRFLEAAAPREATVGRSIEVMAMVRENESAGGLREFLRTEESPRLTAEDVRERSFDVEFPLDKEAKPQPLDITLRLESPGFDPQTQIKKLKVPPHGDSQACTFFIIPRVVGELVVNLELLNIHEQVLASRWIRTRALPSGVETSSDKIVVTIPLTLVVSRNGDRILGMVPAPMPERSDSDENVRTRIFPTLDSETAETAGQEFTGVPRTDQVTDVTAKPTENTDNRAKSTIKVGRDGGGNNFKSGDLTGKIFSHYRVLDVIGRGGMGTVYKAEDLNTGRLVAIAFLGDQLVTGAPKFQQIGPQQGEICDHEGQRFVVLDLDIEASARSSRSLEYPELLERDTAKATGPSGTLQTGAQEQITSAQIFDDEVLRKGDLIGKNFSHYRLLGVVRWDRASATYEAEDLKSHAKVELRFLLHPEQHEYHTSEIHRHEGVGFVVRDRRSIRPESRVFSAGDQNTLPEPHQKRRTLLFIFTGILALVISGVVFLPSVRLRPSLKSNNADAIVVADFSNATDVPEFGGPGPFPAEDRFDVNLLRKLGSALQLPPTLPVLSQDRVRDTLKQLNRNPDEPLTPDLAREVCQRENCKGVLARSVTLKGEEYRIDATVTDCHSGATLAIVQGKTSNPADVPKVLQEVTSQLLGKLGASNP